MATGDARPAQRSVVDARRHRALAESVVDALAYADLFDWPLSAAEIHRALPVAASFDEVGTVLSHEPRPVGVVSRGDVFALAHREALFDRRDECIARSARLWPVARRLGRRVARLPWVRLVAVTGSLAVNAAEADADVDLLVVTADDRLWLARALTIAAGRTAPKGVVLCPNYLLATSALDLPERDRFTAHELAQLVPLHGAPTYRELLARNAWYREHLPNHRPTPVDAVTPGHATQRLVERALALRSVGRLERWERERKIARLRPPSTADDEVRFDAAVCKGHFERHRERVLAVDADRVPGGQVTA